jgi:hypothetical protein
LRLVRRSSEVGIGAAGFIVVIVPVSFALAFIDAFAFATFAFYCPFWFEMRVRSEWQIP